MFKCWIYISGENQNSLCSQEHISDTNEVYVPRIKEDIVEKETQKIYSYIPGMRRFEFLERFINFS